MRNEADFILHVQAVKNPNIFSDRFTDIGVQLAPHRVDWPFLQHVELLLLLERRATPIALRC